MDRIAVTSPLLPPLEEFIPYLEKIWESKWITNNGQFHEQLEKALADYLGVEFISLFTNGTLPLVTALQALGIREGEVINGGGTWHQQQDGRGACRLRLAQLEACG